MTHGVLIVDDDEFIRKLDRHHARGRLGVPAARGGLTEFEALEVARRRSGPSLVFLDVDMPRLNGIDACRSDARVDSATRDSDDRDALPRPTARSVETERAEQAGADLFLTKPFSPLDLLRLVDQLGTG